ncbi:MAG: sporulation protein YqfD [Clostridia bacterium]|nr:sporulation protein YqfD [Clostridia bacterium]
MIISFIHFLRGYLVVRLTGPYIERFINLCVQQRIYMWGIHREKENCIRLSVGIAGFRRMRRPAKATRTHVHILQKRGFPLFLYRHRKRQGFLIGMLIFSLILASLTSFVWDIQIDGLEKIDEITIRNALKSCGLETGVVKYKLKASEIKSKMLSSVPELAWLWVELHGTRAYVHVRERTAVPEMVPAHIPCNVVAARDGVVERIVATRGTPLVTEGDVIQRGMLLISGTVTTKQGGALLVHAQGEITAKTWYEKSGTFPLLRQEKRETGNTEKRYALQLGTYTLPLDFGRKTSFSNFTEEEKSYTLQIGRHWMLPAGFKALIYREIDVEEKKMMPEEAETYYGAQLLEEMQRDLPVEPLNISFSHILQDDGTIFVTCTAECREEIGVTAEILEGN